MNIVQRLTGRFLTINKLNALLAANDLSLDALISGANARLVRLWETVAESEKEASKYLTLVDQYQGAADLAREDIAELEEALFIFSKDEQEQQGDNQ